MPGAGEGHSVTGQLLPGVPGHSRIPPPELCPRDPPTTRLWASVFPSVKWAGGTLMKVFQLTLFRVRRGLLIVGAYVLICLQILFLQKVLGLEMV